MKPVLIIPVQIPYNLFIQFKPLVGAISEEEFNQWNAWRQQLYQESHGMMPLVQYFVGTMCVPDTYGYLYTLHIAMQGMDKSKINIG